MWHFVGYWSADAGYMQFYVAIEVNAVNVLLRDYVGSNTVMCAPTWL